MCLCAHCHLHQALQHLLPALRPMPSLWGAQPDTSSGLLVLSSPHSPAMSPLGTCLLTLLACNSMDFLRTLFLLGRPYPSLHLAHSFSTQLRKLLSQKASPTFHWGKSFLWAPLVLAQHPLCTLRHLSAAVSFLEWEASDMPLLLHSS